ncbi:hypothetical protein KQI48_05815 [Cellulomonas hominis]|uniref:hypothetical protein n=1 Tax=Cellulomonas hominis TaxID=156981 RepID=UPI001C10538B|nr:hypothetical protein [Cellulomonas hominis]MBU5422174.1 hypothetical protein [Cellulomonas hominis]
MFYVVLLGGEVDVRDAQTVPVEHVGASGCDFILVVNETPTAKLSPFDVSA